MEYLIKFDERGRRRETYVADEKTQEEKQALLDDGFELISEEDYQLLIGNVDGKEYIRIYDTQGNAHYVEYEPPAPSLDELKAAKIAELKNQRNAEEVQPIEYNGMKYDYDTNARERINAAIIALDVAGNNTSIEWTLADNTTATVTADVLRQVVAAVAMRSNSLHIAYRKAKEKVEGATTVEEIDKITLLKE